MNNYTKTIVSAVQAWTADQIKQSKPDWNQNDPSGVGYIKNRTHYEEIENKTLVDNLTREDYESGNHPNLTFTVGSLYTVIWNGETYSNIECVKSDDWRVLGIPGTLPFYIDDDGGNNLYISSANENEDYIVSIIGNVSTLKTIDPKFLPDGIGYDTRQEKVIFSAPLSNRVQIYNLIKLSNIIENIYHSTHISIDLPEYDFSLEKAIISLHNEPDGLYIYCSQVDDNICVYFESQLIADEFFNEYYRINEDEMNPLTPGLYALGMPVRLAITLWELSGELHTIDSKYLPDFQSDWNEINSDSPKYINNKPFGESMLPIIENLTPDDYSNDNYEAPTFIVGETYTVIWNGETYSNLTCWDNGGDHVIGNEPNTPQLPFWVDDNGGNSSLDIDWIEEFENVTIYQESGEIKQIDEKFLPILSKQESNNILINNQTIEASNDKWVEFNEDLAFEINPKAKYTIIFNDVEYTDLIPWYDEDIYVIGSEDVWNGYSDSETPFVSDGMQFGTNDNYDSYKLTIIEHNLVNKIDPKYLPDNGTASGGGTISANYLTLNDIDTNYEYIVAIKQGGLVSVCKGVELSVVKPPRQMQYAEGEPFNPEGMVLSLSRQDGSISTITDCNYRIPVYDSSIEIIYTELSMEYTTVLENIIVVPQYKAEALIDFNYIYNPDTGMCQILSWKGTEYGSPSSVIRVPNEDYVIL